MSLYKTERKDMVTRISQLLKPKMAVEKIIQKDEKYRGRTIALCRRMGGFRSSILTYPSGPKFVTV